jgi:hypothetical protein
VVPQERRPGLPSPRGARQGAQVARDAALGDLEAEAEGGAPGILRDHPPDESANLAREGRSRARGRVGRAWPSGGSAGGPRGGEASSRGESWPRAESSMVSARTELWRARGRARTVGVERLTFKRAWASLHP